MIAGLEMSTSQLDAVLRPFTDSLGIRHGALDTSLLFTLGFARWAPIFGIVPFLGGRLLPNSIKIALGFLMALLVLPFMSATLPAPLPYSTLHWTILLLREAFVGFLLAFSISLVFWAAEMGGQFVDNVRGTTTANLLIPHERVQSSLLGDFYYQLFIVLYVVAGGHRWFLGAVFQSYELVPPGQPGLTLEISSFAVLQATGQLFVIMLKIIAPALIVLMLMDLMLGVANRMAPQLDVFFISLSLKSAVGALIIGLSLYYLLALTPQIFEGHHRWIGEALPGLAPKS